MRMGNFPESRVQFGRFIAAISLRDALLISLFDALNYQRISLVGNISQRILPFLFFNQREQCPYPEMAGKIHGSSTSQNGDAPVEKNQHQLLTCTFFRTFKSICLRGLGHYSFGSWRRPLGARESDNPPVAKRLTVWK
jgi:hypothetical protein